MPDASELRRVTEQTADGCEEACYGRHRIALIVAELADTDRGHAARSRWVEALAETLVATRFAVSRIMPEPGVARRADRYRCALVHLADGGSRSRGLSDQELAELCRRLPVAVFGRRAADPQLRRRLWQAGVVCVFLGLPARSWPAALGELVHGEAAARQTAHEHPPVISSWSELAAPGSYLVRAATQAVVLTRRSFGRWDRPAFSSALTWEGPERSRTGESMAAEIRGLSDGVECRVEVVDHPLDLADPEARRWWLQMLEQTGGRWTLPVARLAESSEPSLGRLRRVGFERLRLQVASGSPQVCERLAASTQPAEAAQMLRLAAEVEISSEVVLLAGAPGEGPDEVRETTRWLITNGPRISRLQVRPFVPDPGSEMATDPDRYGIWWPPGEGIDGWVDRQGSNRSARAKRAHELAVLARDLGVETELSGAEVVADVDHHAGRAAVRLRRQAREGRAHVVLATTPPWGTANPPVGLGYLAEALAASGRTCRIVDGNALLYREAEPALRHLWHYENKNFWSNPEVFVTVEKILAPGLDRVAAEIEAASPKLVGLSVVDPKELCTAALVRRLRKRGMQAPIVLGGPACLEPEQRGMLAALCGSEIIGYVVGEGEGPLVELVDRLAAGEPLDGVPGFVPHHRPERQVCPWRADLKSILFPRYGLFDEALHSCHSMIVEWSRGCIGKCSFCKGHEVEGVYRHREPASVVEELAWHAARGYRELTICDSELNANLGFLRRVCELIVERGLELVWRGQAIPRAGMDAELLALMRRAGCEEIQYGIESGSDQVLEIMGKSRLFTVAEAEQALRATRQAGIAVSLFLIAGHPGEDGNAFAETLDLLRRNATWIDSIKSVNALHVIRGTDLHRRPDTFGIVQPEGMHGYREWYSCDGSNTPEQRRERVLRVLCQAHQLDIPVLEHNLEDDKADRSWHELAASDTPGDALRRLIVVPELAEEGTGISVEVAGPCGGRAVSRRCAAPGPRSPCDGETA